MKKIFSIFFICALVMLSRVEASAQDRTIDSLKLALKNAKHDTIRIKLLSELSDLCEVLEIPNYADPCIALCEQGIEKSKDKQKLFYRKYLANALNNKGVAAHQQGDVSTAITYYRKSLLIQEEINDKEGLSHSLNNLGVIYDNQGDISNALDCYYKALAIQEEKGDKKAIGFSLYNLAFLYQSQGDANKALEFYTKSLKIRKEINDKLGIAASMNNIGLVYKKQGEAMLSRDSAELRQHLMDKALDYFHQSLTILEQVGDKGSIAFALSGIGTIYNSQAEVLYPKDEQRREKMINQAIDYYNKSLLLQKEINDKKGIAYTLGNISTALFELGKIKEAETLAQQNIQLSKELRYPENIKRAAAILKEIYAKQNKPKEALAMYELEIQMRDSINNTETKKISIKKQFQYEYEKQAAADSVKNAEEQKVKDAQLAAQSASLKQEKTQRYALYGGLVLILGFLIFVINRFRLTQKQKKIIEDQKVLVDKAYEHLHEKNKEVMDSIRYAKRIQSALLTSEKYIERNLKKLAKKN